MGNPPGGLAGDPGGVVLGAVGTLVFIRRKGLLLGLSEGTDHGAELEDLKVTRALAPVMDPAHDQVTAFRRVAVVSEGPAFEFELDTDPLPLAGPDLSLRLAVGEAGLNSLDQVAQLAGDHAEDEHDALLVHGLVA